MQNVVLLINCYFAFVVHVQQASLEVPWVPKVAAEMKGSDFEWSADAAFVDVKLACLEERDGTAADSSWEGVKVSCEVPSGRLVPRLGCNQRSMKLVRAEGRSQTVPKQLEYFCIKKLQASYCTMEVFLQDSTLK